MHEFTVKKEIEKGSKLQYDIYIVYKDSEPFKKFTLLSMAESFIYGYETGYAERGLKSD